MTLNDCFRDINSRVGAYTYESRGKIPDQPGIYAWKLPCYPWKNFSLEDIVRITAHFFHPEGGIPLSGNQTWRHLEACLTSTPQKPTDTVHRSWDKITKDPELIRHLERSMLELALITPPLYVGKANSLCSRYDQHRQYPSDDQSKFRGRFLTAARRADVPLDLSDLVFFTITAPAEEAHQAQKTSEYWELLEKLTQYLTTPAFSIR
jgi:hypothetical protein